MNGSNDGARWCFLKMKIPIKKEDDKNHRWNKHYSVFCHSAFSLLSIFPFPLRLPFFLTVSFTKQSNSHLDIQFSPVCLSNLNSHPRLNTTLLQYFVYLFNYNFKFVVFYIFIFVFTIIILCLTLTIIHM